MTARKLAEPIIGSPKPRIAPPVPARFDREFAAMSAELGITLMPWQELGSRYLTATGRDGRHLYREVALVVARQQGKTTLMKPVIIRALKAGKKVMHIAQTRELPRVMFSLIAASLPEEMFPKRRGKGGKLQTIWPRFGSGQEEILIANGGSYRIAASSSGGARGWSNDLVIFDELREMDSFDPINAAEPTMMMSEDPQTIYLSNAGTDASVVLNAIRKRREDDPSLAYLEWSAAPERSADDRAGWAEANPALGHYPQVIRELEKSYTRHSLSGTIASFETENLCRWVKTMRELLVDDALWAAGRSPLGKPLRPTIAVSLAPEGTRATIAMAWKQGENVALTIVEDNVGTNLATDPIAERVRDLASRHGSTVAFDPMTDAALVKFVPKAKTAPVNGVKYASASAEFSNLVHSERLKWANADSVTDDLTWTARKPDGDQGSYHAVRAQDDRPVTASFAAIRAVWLASLGRTATPPRIR